LPRLVTDKDLMSAIGLNSAAFNGATLIGPLIGGVLIIPFGVGGLMLINAISYLAVVAALLVIAPQPSEVRQRLSMLASIREGLAYIRGDPVLRWVVVSRYPPPSSRARTFSSYPRRRSSLALGRSSCRGCLPRPEWGRLVARS
jgi:MFS family permease